MKLPSRVKAAWRALRFPKPSGILCGTDSIIGTPRNITGAEHIVIGHRARIGANPMIAALSEYAGERFAPQIHIGNDVYIGPNLYLVCVSSVVIGNGCVLSENVFIADVSHGMSPTEGLIMQQRLAPGRPIEIGESTFIGFGAMIMPGVKLGKWCVVAAGSVVTKSFSDHSMIAGNPARLVRTYSLATNEWKNPVSMNG